MTSAAATPYAKPYLFELRMAAMSGAGFAVAGIHLPFFPIWMASIGMTPWQIALLMALPMAVRIPVAPFLLSVADRSRDRALVLTLVSLACAILSAGFIFETGFWPILLITVLLGIAWAPQVPLIDAITLSGVRRYGSDYAAMRVWGSIAFLAASFGCGNILDAFGHGSVPFILCAGFTLAFAVSLATPRIGRPRDPSSAGSLGLVDMPHTLLRPHFVLFIAAVSLVQASHAFLYSFSSIYWSSLGISASLIGALWAAGLIAEIAVFFVFRPLLGHLDPQNVLIAGGAVAVLRWLAFPLVEAFDIGIGGFFVLQTLHAVTFAITFLAMQAMIASDVEEADLGSAQGFYTFVSGIVLAAAMLLSGPLYNAAGAGGFAGMAILAAAGVGLAVWLRVRYPHTSGAGGETSEPV